MKKLLVLLAVVMVAPLARADAVVGRAIAEALNKGDIEAVLRTMDVEAVGRQVIKDLGLNDSDRERVLKVFPSAVRTNVEIGVRSMQTSKGSARFMRSGVRDSRPFALLRYDLEDQGIDYVEYYLTSSGRVEDWYVHSLAANFSTLARLSLATALKTDSMLYGMFGTLHLTAADTKPFADLRTHLQAQDFAGAYRTLERFPEEFRKTRQWALMRVSYGGRIDEQTHRAALRQLAKDFGGDPALQFMLVDHYFFEQQFERALAAIGALERGIGGEDAATMNLRGNVLLAAKRYGDASTACRRGMQLEPGHKAAYWCLVAVGLGHNDGKVAVEGLKAYESAFGVRFNLDQLAAQAEYKQIATTPEFAAWRNSRKK